MHMRSAFGLDYSSVLHRLYVFLFGNAEAGDDLVSSSSWEIHAFVFNPSFRGYFYCMK